MLQLGVDRPRCLLRTASWETQWGQLDACGLPAVTAGGVRRRRVIEVTPAV